MNDESMNPNDQPEDGGEPQPSGEGGQFTQQVRHQQVSALVPEHVARGVFATGSLVLQGNHEFVLDFIVAVSRPHQVVARVILPPTIVPSMIRALQQNIDNFTKRFGPPPAMPKPPQPVKPPSVEEIYDQLKISDEVMCGVYANTLMITHSPAEFVLDFITSFYPKSAVSARVFLSAPQVPRLLETLSRSFEQFQRKMAERQRQYFEQQRGQGGIGFGGIPGPGPLPGGGGPNQGPPQPPGPPPMQGDLPGGGPDQDN